MSDDPEYLERFEEVLPVHGRVYCKLLRHHGRYEQLFVLFSDDPKQRTSFWRRIGSLLRVTCRHPQRLRDRRAVATHRCTECHDEFLAQTRANLPALKARWKALLVAQEAERAARLQAVRAWKGYP